MLHIRERLLTIREVLSEQLGESALPEMEVLLKTVNTVAQACDATDLSTLIPGLTGESQAEGNTVAESDEQQPAAAARNVDWRSIQPATREDAQLMLEKARQYFLLYEPSHPAPLLIERVQRLIEMNFMDIIRDLAPDGVHQLENIFGRRD